MQFFNNSRFYFNLSFFKILQKIFEYIKYKNIDHKKILSEKFKDFFPNSNFFYFDYGRSGFYFLLKYFPPKSKKKILINSLTLFEMVNMIIYAGYEPIFVDNKKNSFESNICNLLDKHYLEVRFVVVTHLNGSNNEIFEIREKIDEINKNLNEDEKILLVEDVAVSFGAKIKNFFCGSIGDFSILSFNIMKNITSLTGGALIDNQNLIKDISKLNYYDEISTYDLFKKILFVFLLQFLNSKLIFPFFFIFIKFAHKKNYKFFLKKYRTDFQTSIESQIPVTFLKKISNFQLFLLRDQFDEIKKNNNKRIKNSLYIYEHLKNNENLIFPQTKFNENNIFIEFPILCKKKEFKDNIFYKSLDENIDIKNYYYKNCASEKIYLKFKDNECKNANFISENILMLPVNVNQTKNSLDKIINLFN
jgi:dTDP-4-amino-4,6-dideoxygalactose transaminase